MNYSDPLDGVFKALADGRRRAILVRLTRGEATLSALAGPLEISLPAVHQHVAVLEDARLIESRKRGRERLCRLDGRGLSRAEGWLRGRRRLWERRLDRLDALLRAEESEREKG